MPLHYHREENHGVTAATSGNKVRRTEAIDVALASMIAVSAVEIGVNVVWALTPFSFTQTMACLPAFALVDNVAMAYVSGQQMYLLNSAEFESLNVA